MMKLNFEKFLSDNELKIGNKIHFVDDDEKDIYTITKSKRAFLKALNGINNSIIESLLYYEFEIIDNKERRTKLDIEKFLNENGLKVGDKIHFVTDYKDDIYTITKKGKEILLSIPNPNNGFDDLSVTALWDDEFEIVEE